MLFSKFRKPKMNRTITLLTLSDIFAWGGFTVVSVLMGLYLSEKLGANAARIVGTGMGVYLVFRSVAQVPLGLLLDKIKRDKDDIIVLFVGSVLMGAAFLFYPLITSEHFFYFLQGILGLGASMNLIAWRKLFAENVSKGYGGASYGVYGAVMGLATAILSFLGGVVANIGPEYFDIIMIVMGFWVMLGGLWAIMIFTAKERNSQHG